MIFDNSKRPTQFPKKSASCNDNPRKVQEDFSVIYYM
jgi:hypothetical protein